MKALLVYIIGACACAQPTVYLSQVDPRVAPLLARIERDLIELHRPDLIKHMPHGMKVVIDNDAVLQRYIERQGQSMAFCDLAHERIVLPEPGVWFHYGKHGFMVTPKGLEITLAHELGHALGLEHTDKGLMQPQADATCINRAAACLLEALDYAATKH